MNRHDCFYCSKDERLQNLMTKICTIDCADIYLFKDQRYAGRCVVALDEHYEEMFQIPQEKLSNYMKVVSKVAEVIYKLFEADKINYAIYGDLVSHFHVHVVPKKKDNLEWGTPFTDNSEKIYLTSEDFNKRIELIRNALKDK